MSQTTVLPQVDLTDDAGQQVVHLDVDQGRHFDVLTVVRVGDRLAFCNDNKRLIYECHSMSDYSLSAALWNSQRCHVSWYETAISFFLSVL